MIQTKNLIIGFGKAGKTLAGLFNTHGEETMLVEQSAQMYGGTCINIGCIPSKKLIFEGKNTNFATAMTNKDKLIGALREANFKRLDDLPHVTVVNAQASFIDNHTVELSTGQRVYAQRIFINTGATSVMPKVAGVDGLRIHDSTGLLNLSKSANTAPKRLVIIGAGFIALEFAFMYANFGSEVTLVEKFDQFLPSVDDDVRQIVFGLLDRRGIKLHLGQNLQKFEHFDTHTDVITDKMILPADAVLVAMGRRPNTDALNLQNTSVKLTERGHVVCDETLKAAENIWAMGDVAGSPQFTYISLDDYRIIANHLYGDGTRHTSDRQVFPTSVFITPPLSQIGMNENQAKQSGKNYAVATMPAVNVVKAKITGATDGLLKAIIDKDSREILGVTLFCEDSHEVINLFKLAMDNGVTADYFKNQIFTHPTISEALNDLFAQF